MLLGAKLRKARREAGLTQAELAGSELSRSFISEIERNERNPSIATISLFYGRSSEVRLRSRTVTDQPSAHLPRVRRQRRPCVCTRCFAANHPFTGYA
ncbi:MAG: helix-turn-helix transcriptional regulator [Thermaerobacter sp.]|nr:helix-turn-helix transcriptional regulator [Thermaerobacter sp.]